MKKVMTALESGNPWLSKISFSLFIEVRDSFSPELLGKISCWHDVKETKHRMKRVMLDLEHGGVFDYEWAAVVWVKERKQEKLLKIKYNSERIAFIAETVQNMKHFYWRVCDTGVLQPFMNYFVLKVANKSKRIAAVGRHSWVTLAIK